VEEVKGEERRNRKLREKRVQNLKKRRKRPEVGEEERRNRKWGERREEKKEKIRRIFFGKSIVRTLNC